MSCLPEQGVQAYENTKKERGIPMGKGQRNRLNNAGRKEEMRRQQQQLLQKRRRNRIIGISIGAVVAVAAIGFGTKYAIDQQRLQSGDDLRATIMLESENYQVTGTMMSVYTNSLYQSYVSQYGEYLSYLGLDTTKSLKEQEYTAEQTWFDYLTSSAETSAKEYLVLAEAAKEAGVSLTDGEIENIEKGLEGVDLSYYGVGVNEEDVKEALLLQGLAIKYENILKNDLTYTDEEAEAYYEENKYDFLRCDTLTYTFSYSDDTSDEDAMTQKQAKLEANSLAACTDEESFKKWLEDYLKENSDEELSEEDLTSQVEACKSTLSYTEDDETAEWAFGDDAAVGQTHVAQDTDAKTFKVTLLLSLPARSEDTTIDVRHILLTADRYGSDEAAKAKAEELLEEWKNGDATEESFAKLAGAWSEDGGSSLNGGLYSYVTEGSMVEEFNDWCFDSSRKAGDTDIVKTDYGYHIMYYVGRTTPQWEASAFSSLQSSDYSDKYDSLSKTYTVTAYEDRFDSIPSIT